MSALNPGSASFTRSAALGLVAGFMSGMFGVGGGILIVPILVLALAMPQRRAHGTSLAAVLPIAVSGTVGFGLEGSVDWPAAAALAIGSLLGALVGTKLLVTVSHRFLAYSFAATLLLSAARLLASQPDGGGRGALQLGSVVGLALVGVLAGTLAGLLGVGGGVLMVPAMVILFGIPAAVAKGTSLAVIIPTSVLGTWRNRSNRNADLRVAVVVGLAGVVSAYFASKISIGLSEDRSSQLFAALLTIVAVHMLIAERQRGAEPVDVEPSP